MPASLDECHSLSFFLWVVALLEEVAVYSRLVLSTAATSLTRADGKRSERLNNTTIRTHGVPGALPETPLDFLGSCVEGGVFLDRDPLSHFGQRNQAEKLVSGLRSIKETDQPSTTNDQ